MRISERQRIRGPDKGWIQQEATNETKQNTLFDPEKGNWAQSSRDT